MKSLLKTYFYLYILSLYCHCLFKDSSLLHHSRHYLQQSKYIHNKLFDSSATSIAQEPESPTLTTSGVVKTFFDTYTSSPGTSQYTDINKFQEFGSEIIKKSNVPNGKEEAWR